MLVQSDEISVLSIDCPIEGFDERLSVTEVKTARQALGALRMLQFDLMVTQAAVAGEPIWLLAAKVRAIRPRLRWMLVAGQLSAEEESRARMLGVAQIVEDVPTRRDLLTACHPRPVMKPTYAPLVPAQR